MYYERRKETISEKNGKENECNFVSKRGYFKDQMVETTEIKNFDGLCIICCSTNS